MPVSYAGVTRIRFDGSALNLSARTGPPTVRMDIATDAPELKICVPDRAKCADNLGALRPIPERSTRQNIVAQIIRRGPGCRVSDQGGDGVGPGL